MKRFPTTTTSSPSFFPAVGLSLVAMLLLLVVATLLRPPRLANNADAAAAVGGVGSSDADAAASAPLKVFILAGQSNMVGMGSIQHLDTLVQDNSSSSNEYRSALWDDASGQYRTKGNVYIRFNDNHGKLTVGPKTGYAGGRNNFGPELMFGWVVGDALQNEEKVLLIKTAWGGRCLATHFRPPSSGEGNYTGVRPIEYGRYYREMVAGVLDTLKDLKTFVPEYDPTAGYQLSGLVWFQGWNDMLDAHKVFEYGPNLANLIRDVRLDLEAPGLPVVVGELGMHGDGKLPTRHGVAARVMAMRAQEHAVTLLEPFRNNTLFVRYVSIQIHF